MSLPLAPRPLFFLLFLFCAGLLGFGLYLQHFEGLEPCPMCIMQRYALATIGVIGLIAGLHGPRRTGVRLYGALLLLVALTGGGIAARQSWMQLYPPKISECGPDLEYMLGSFPLADALPMIFRGAGDCTAIDWTFLNLSIANWSLINFTLIAVFALLMMWRPAGRFSR